MKNARIIRETAAGGGITSAGAESESDFKLSSTYHRKPKDEAEWKFCWLQNICFNAISTMLTRLHIVHTFTMEFSKGLSFVVGDTHFEAHSLSTLCLLSFVFPVTGALWRCSVHFTWLPEGFSVQVSILRVCVFCIYQCHCVCIYMYLYYMQSVF